MHDSEDMDAAPVYLIDEDIDGIGGNHEFPSVFHPSPAAQARVIQQ
jgi:hypothetical protein